MGSEKERKVVKANSVYPMLLQVCINPWMHFRVVRAVTSPRSPQAIGLAELTVV